MTQASVMNYLLHEALPLTVPYGAQTLSTIAYHPVKVGLSCSYLSFLTECLRLAGYQTCGTLLCILNKS
jgi:hypothetical protein